MVDEVARQKLLKNVSPITRLDAARNYKELFEALGDCVDDMMKRERAGEKVDGDSAFIIGMVYGKMRRLQETAGAT